MTTPPNIVLILADDLGFSDLACFGGEIATPNLDRIARDGVRMSQFYNTARCSPSRASLLTGRHPHETGIGILTEDERPWGYPGDLSSEYATLAERLKTAGYATSLSGKWHLSSSMDEPSASWPTRRGFDDFYGIVGGAGDYFHPRNLWRREERLPIPGEGYYFTDAIVEHAVEFVREAVHEVTPFFQYLAFTAPHWPLHAPEEEIESYAHAFDAGWDELRRARLERLVASGILNRGATLSDRDPAVPAWEDEPEKAWQSRRMAVYAAQVASMDRAVGVLIDELERLGVLDDTIVMFLSDNGASAEDLPPDDAPHFRSRQPSHTVTGEPMRIGNEPRILPGGPSSYSSYGVGWANLSNAPFRLYKRWVHEGGISTPLLARWGSGGLAGGSVVEAPHQLTDVVPTLLTAAGLGVDGPGSSMLGSWRGESPAAQPLFWEHIGNGAVREGDWKAVREAGGEWELYDLSVDRIEQNDLAASHPERLRELVGLWTAWADGVGVIDWATYGPPPETETDEEVRL